MNDLRQVFEAASRLQSFFQSQGWNFCFIGGVAVQRWGEPRFTQDVDVTLLTGFGNEEPFLDALLQRFQPRRENARAFALTSRVALLRAENGVDLDVALGAVPFEERSIKRASAWRIPAGGSLVTCSAEDLVVHKAFAGRERDWGDVESVLTRQHGKLDLNVIRTELRPLLALKENPEAMDQLDRLLTKVTRRLQA